MGISYTMTHTTAECRDKLKYMSTRLRFIIGAFICMTIVHPLAAGALTLTRTLAVGSTGHEVTLLQTFLKDQGLYTYPSITGRFGAATWRAVVTLQKSHGIDPNGVVGPRTRVLIATISAPPTSAATSAPISTAPPVAISPAPSVTPWWFPKWNPGPGYTPGFGGGSGTQAAAPDTTAPTMSGIPSTQTVEAAGSSGAIVSYTAPTAADSVDPAPSVSCLPASGSTFAIGTTVVTCTATDSSNNSSTATFNVIVRDTTAPSVSLTAPLDGATASTSNVSLTATASDVVGVAGVQFKLDGTTLIGSEDTSAPYGVAWDSTAASAGSHTIVAVARDAAGNYATSTAANVTVVLYPPYTSNLALFLDAGQSSMTTSSGLVSSITDLSSHAVVATSTGALRPTLVTYGGHSGLRFAGGQELMTDTNWTMNRQNSSLFVVSRTQLGGTGGLSTYALTYMPQSGGTNRLAAYFNGNTFSGYDSAPKSSGFIHGHGIETDYLVLSGAAAKLGVGAQETSLAAFPAGTVSGGKIGRWDGTTFPLDTTDILAVIAYDRALSVAETSAVRDWIASQYGAVGRTQNTAIIFEGDSLTYGIDSSDNLTMSYPAQLSRLSSTPPKIWNGGSGGDTALNNNAASATKTILTGIAGYTNRIVVYWMGTNDIANGRTAGQLEGDIASYIAAVRAADPSAVIFGNTIIARDPFNASQDTEIADVNTWIKNSAGFDHVVDLAADSRLSNALDTTYFYSDGIHLNDTGYGVVANLVRTAINAAGFSI